MRLLLALLFFPVLVQGQQVTDSVHIYTQTGQLIKFTQNRWYTPYTTGDSLFGRSNEHKTRVLIHPLDLPINTATQTALDGKASTSHTHSGVYQPVGSYLVAADITGKANIASPTFTGTVTLPDNTVTNTMLAGSIAQSKITNYAGYTINVQALTSSPTDAQTVYFGTLPKAPVTAAATSKIYIRQAGTITGAELYCYSGTAGTNESWSLYVRVNNTTDYLIATVATSASERVFSNTGLSIAVSSGDYIEIKSVQPTWATNPLTTIFGGYIRIN